MKKFLTLLLSVPLSIITYAVELFFIVLSQLVQFLALKIFGYKAHKVVVQVWCGLILLFLRIIGTRFKFECPYDLPKDAAVIIVSNHQSLFDIPPFGWFFRKLHPKYVSKKELGKGLFGVSYNLKHGGSVLIDRADVRQSLSALKDFALRLEEKQWAGVIFPEGTRGHNGKPRKFKETGLQVLCKYAPNAWVIPVTLNDSWKLSNPMFPLRLGVKITMRVHQPLRVSDMGFKALHAHLEQTITENIKY